MDGFRTNEIFRWSVFNWIWFLKNRNKNQNPDIDSKNNNLSIDLHVLILGCVNGARSAH